MRTSLHGTVSDRNTHPRYTPTAVEHLPVLTVRHSRIAGTLMTCTMNTISSVFFVCRARILRIITITVIVARRVHTDGGRVTIYDRRRRTVFSLPTLRPRNDGARVRCERAWSVSFFHFFCVLPAFRFLFLIFAFGETECERADRVRGNGQPRRHGRDSRRAYSYALTTRL